MEYIDLTLSTPAENLALDEALLDFCDSGEIGNVLRFWESPLSFVVLGYGNHTEKEVDVAACARAEIPILRRCSGGGAVLQGPGCLNYALVLRIEENAELESISSANCFIMTKHREAMRGLGMPVEISGHTDLAINYSRALKFSGNSQRRKRAALLFHGTFLYNFDLRLIEQTLRFPSLQPDYRQDRSHSNFVTNISLPASTLRTAVRRAWGAFVLFDKLNLARVGANQLVQTKYGLPVWNRKM